MSSSETAAGIRKGTADASLFRVSLSFTFNYLQVADGCVSPSKHVQVRPIVGCVVGCVVSHAVFHKVAVQCG